MAEYLEVTTKYCDKCEHKSYCYKPCPSVLAALNDFPCEQELVAGYSLVQNNTEKEVES